MGVRAGAQGAKGAGAGGNGHGERREAGRARGRRRAGGGSGRCQTESAGSHPREREEGGGTPTAHPPRASRRFGPARPATPARARDGRGARRSGRRVRCERRSAARAFPRIPRPATTAARACASSPRYRHARVPLAPPAPHPPFAHPAPLRDCAGRQRCGGLGRTAREGAGGRRVGQAPRTLTPPGDGKKPDGVREWRGWRDNAAEGLQGAIPAVGAGEGRRKPKSTGAAAWARPGRAYDPGPGSYA